MTEDLSPILGMDLLSPRFAIVTNRHLMEPYHRLESHAELVREAARADFAPGILTVLKCIRLFDQSFHRIYTLPESISEDEAAAHWLRLDMLGFAGTTYKSAFDQLLDGYYSQGYMLIRNMIDAWRRELFIRLSDPEDVWRWFVRDGASIPESVTNRPGFAPNQRLPNYDEMKTLVDACGSERDQNTFAWLGEAFLDMNDHAHPSMEAMTQMRWGQPEGKRAFGPNYSAEHLRRGLRDLQAVGIELLREINLLEAQDDQWFVELCDVADDFKNWALNNDQMILPPQ